MSFKKKVNIKIITKAPAEELRQLYKEAGWWEDTYDTNFDFLNHIPENSACFAGAFYEKRLIGMGRALSDCKSDAYIQDVTVLKAHRGQGIGKEIIKVLVAWLRGKGVDWIGLVAEPGTTSFYSEIGFEPLKGHIAMRYKDNK